MKHIFAKYCDPKPAQVEAKHELLVPPTGAVLTARALDDWARDTNGAPFSEETKEEVRTRGLIATARVLIGLAS